MHSFTLLSVALATFQPILAHMTISWPPPLRSPLNPFSVAATIDYTLTAPLLADGSNFPFKGYNSDLDGSGGASVANFRAGAPANITVNGGAPHGGGSCQISLTYDKGTTFAVIHSFIGSCPLTTTQTLDFTIPSDAPSGPAVLVWSWANLIGNREFYLSPSSITVTAAAADAPKPAVAFGQRPSMFLINLGNGCKTTEGQELVYPNPGPDADVTIKRTTAQGPSGFTGDCAAVKGVSAGSGGGGTGAAAVAPPSNTVAPPSPSSTQASSALPSIVEPSNQPGGVFATTATSSNPLATNGASPPSALTTTSDGQCSGAHTCAGSTHGSCCSKWGWCGSTSDHCGVGCQAGFGTCGLMGIAANIAGKVAESGSAFENAQPTETQTQTLTETLVVLAPSGDAKAAAVVTLGFMGVRGDIVAASGFVTSVRSASASASAM